MRPIKFRAWDKINEKMYDVTVIDFESESVQVLHFDEWDSVDPKTKKPVRCCFMKKYGKHLSFDDIVLEEFTGLKDKNGKEIYEGDKVRIIWPTSMKDNYKVEWVHRAKAHLGGFQYSEMDNSKYYTGSVDHNVEVIGTIHDKEKP